MNSICCICRINHGVVIYNILFLEKAILNLRIKHLLWSNHSNATNTEFHLDGADGIDSRTFIGIELISSLLVQTLLTSHSLYNGVSFSLSCHRR